MANGTSGDAVTEMLYRSTWLEGLGELVLRKPKDKRKKTFNARFKTKGLRVEGAPGGEFLGGGPLIENPH